MAEVQVGLALAILLAFNVPVCRAAAMPDPACQDEETQAELYKECFDRIPTSVLSDLMKVFEDQRNEESVDSNVAAILNVVCSKREVVQPVIECVLGKARGCVPEQFRKYILRQAAVGQLLESVCADYTNLMVGCVMSTYANVMTCVSNKITKSAGNSSQMVSTDDMACQAYQLGVSCMETELRTCGCHTVKTIQTLIGDVMYPSLCPAYTSHRVQCDANNPQIYADNGEQRHTDNGGQRHADNGGQRHTDNGGQRHADNGGQRHADNGGQRHADNGGQRHTDNVGQRHADNGGQRHAGFAMPFFVVYVLALLKC